MTQTRSIPKREISDFALAPDGRACGASARCLTAVGAHFFDERFAAARPSRAYFETLIEFNPSPVVRLCRTTHQPYPKQHALKDANGRAREARPSGFRRSKCAAFRPKRESG
jgi:hypothetical protein